GITYSGIKNINNDVPSGYKLYQNYPNPFNPTTKIKFDVRAKGNTENVILKVYNVIGKEVTTLVNEELKSGSYEITWNGESINSGTYFYKIQIGNYIETKRMVLLK
ncbi:MAG: T9SS type A sorting domain-containing protein, partial [Ignavibacteriae bacterium]|nr:T9SS type A sorting domain-containing protein [Ignavibacteriota bacterium]